MYFFLDVSKVKVVKLAPFNIRWEIALGIETGSYCNVQDRWGNATQKAKR
jgi:hypothetical protein